MLSFLAICCAHSAELKLADRDLPRVPPTEPGQVLSTFKVKPGFRMELVAAEPLVVDPIAMAFDENGRLFVVEMRDYSERRDERLGRVRLLEDSDNDGRFDKSNVYADGLPWPTAVICWNGGVFVGATPDILYFKDTNNDGVADTRELIFTGFGAGTDRLNVQQLLNSFNWSLDNRIHGASGGNGGSITSPKRLGAKPVQMRGRDFSFDPRTFEIRAETGGAQHGLSFDDHGRKFVCSNSAHIQTLIYEERYAGRNPFYTMPRPLIDIAEDGPAAEVFRLSPDEPWRVIRTQWRIAGKVPGPIEGGGRASGYFTAATGVMIYRGNAFPDEYRGDAFIADCGSNLIHRKKLFPDGVSLIARRPLDEQRSEIVASTDNWFRPVQFANAPDGTLYVADMYRETIEHPWSLPEPLKSKLDLNSGNDRGRIYRIVPDGFKQPAKLKLGAASDAELVETLAHANGWHRDTAARLLYERQSRATVPVLEKLFQSSASDLGRQHVLYALDGLQALEEKHLLTATADRSPRVREQAARLASQFAQRTLSDAAWKKLLVLAEDSDARVRYQLAFTLGDFTRSDRAAALAALAEKDSSDPWMRAAIVNSLSESAGEVFARLIQNSAFLQSTNGIDFISQLAKLIAARSREPEMEVVANWVSAFSQPAQFRVARAFAEEWIARLGQPFQLPGALSQRFEQSLRSAVAVSGDSAAATATRVAATQVLFAVPWTQARAALLPLLDAGNPALRAAALGTVFRFNEREAADAVVKRWATVTPRARMEFLTAALSRSERAGYLLEAIEANQIQRSDLSSSQIDQLRNHRDAEIRQRAAPLLPISTAPRQAVLKTYETALDLKGDATRGRKVFTERCASCHRLGDQGHGVGPDLASVRSNGKVKLLTSIIDPNGEVPPNFFSYLVETKAGESFIGLMVNEAEASVTLRRAFGDETILPRAGIQRIQSSATSLMPEGLEAGLATQDFADLLEYLMAGDVNRP